MNSERKQRFYGIQHHVRSPLVFTYIVVSTCKHPSLVEHIGYFAEPSTCGLFWNKHPLGSLQRVCASPSPLYFIF